MEDVDQFVQELARDLEWLHPDVTEAREEADVLQREQDEIATAQRVTEAELAALAERMAAEQAKLNQLEEQLQALTREHEAREAGLRQADAEVAAGHDAYQETYAKQAALRESLRVLCDVDERLRKLEEQKQVDVQTILDIHTSHQTGMQAALLGQEETKAAEAIEVLNAKLKDHKTRQDALSKALTSANEMHAFHAKREDGFMRTVAQCSRAIQLVQAEEQELTAELKRLKLSGKLETVMDQLKAEQAEIGRLEHEIRGLDQGIMVERKFIAATRLMLAEVRNTLWQSKAELHAHLLSYRSKNGALQGAIRAIRGRKDELQGHVSALEGTRATAAGAPAAPKQLAEFVEELRAAVAQAEAKAAELLRVRERAQDNVEMAEADLRQHPQTRALEQILRKAQQRLAEAAGEHDTAAQRLADLTEKLRAAEAPPEVPEPAPEAHTSALQQDLSEAKKQLAKYNTHLTEVNMMVQGLYAEVRKNEQEVAAQEQTLAKGHASLLDRLTRRAQLANQLAVRQLVAKALAAHTEALTERFIALEKRLADLGPQTKEHRRQQNEVTTKVQKCRQQLATVEKERDRHLRDLMLCNYEVFLAETETRHNWFKMKLLTKDLPGVQEAWGADQEATKQLWRDVAAQRAHLAEQREELQRLEAELPALRKTISKSLSSYPTPMAMVCAKRLQLQDTQELFDVLRPLLLDLALRQAEVEQESADLQDRHNCGTVESALNSPSISGIPVRSFPSSPSSP
eukprot:EG_transcript_3473